MSETVLILRRSDRDMMTHIHWSSWKVVVILLYILTKIEGPGGSVGIASGYGLDGPGRIPVGTRFSASPDRSWGSPSLL